MRMGNLPMAQNGKKNRANDLWLADMLHWLPKPMWTANEWKTLLSADLRYVNISDTEILP